MGRLSRSLIVVFAIALLVAALAASWGGVRRIEAQAGPTSADAAPLVLIGQKPRLQEFFAGNTATFTVGITNTGTVALQTVAIVNATTPACGRTNVGPLAPGQSTSYSCTRTGVNESFMNELEAVGTTGFGEKPDVEPLWPMFWCPSTVSIVAGIRKFRKYFIIFR